MKKRGMVNEAIGKKVGIGHAHVWRILNGHRWQHITKEMASA